MSDGSAGADDGVTTAADDGLAAGPFAAWADAMDAALAGDRDADVPCGTCTACCTSSQFIHIGPHETDALAHIPAALRFPAPGLPKGHVLLGYDERGHCPMLSDGLCTIYDHRPRTCRTYDCRVFPAAGIEVDDATKREIRDRARRWRFDHPTEDDRTEHDAVRAAATYLRERADELPDVVAHLDATQLAVLAVEVRDEFNDGDVPDPERVHAEVSDRLLGP
ncbi:YkgJ family cysteine cluster protein [Aquihabitans sp. McL0605]|uniref:YkgJ family cysteine cluster protein n=1 Tax=Aquihabitans sp. McL0605 TaxID=3415671 RepID=UPI003CEB13F7